MSFTSAPPIHRARPLIPLLCVALLAASPVLGGSGRAAQQTPPPRMHGTVDVRIGTGTDETRDQYIFTAIGGLAMDAQRRIFVADRKDNNIRVFGAAGKFLYTIGRKGPGPGEIDDPCCLTIAADGKLWVSEALNRRYSVFRPGATSAPFERSIRMPLPSNGLHPRITWDTAGRLVHMSFSMQPVTNRSINIRAFVDTAGKIVRQDTLLPPAGDTLRPASFQVTSGGGVATYTSVAPFGAYALHAIGPQGEIASAMSSRYAITWYDANRKPIRTIEQRVDGPLVSARERAEGEEKLVAQAKQLRITRATIPVRVPDRKTPVKNIGFDLDGRLWVERSVADGKPNEADVYDRAGKWTATMEWPAGIDLSLWTIRGQTAVGVASDSMGAVSIVRVQFR